MTIFSTLFPRAWGIGRVPTTDSEPQWESQKVVPLTSALKGSGRMTGRDGTKRKFSQTENLAFKLHSVAILIEGIGRANRKIVHNALAIVACDNENHDLALRSCLQDGNDAKFRGEVIDGKFHWYLKAEMRHISLNDQSQRFEIDDIYRDDRRLGFFRNDLGPDGLNRGRRAYLTAHILW